MSAIPMLYVLGAFALFARAATALIAALSAGGFVQSKGLFAGVFPDDLTVTAVDEFTDLCTNQERRFEAYRGFGQLYGGEGRGYAARFSLPVQLGTRVESLAKDRDLFRAATSAGTFEARSVIVATGAYHEPHVPDFASELSPAIAQRHSSDYRNPDELPEGDVLVVGAGNSGAQIAAELAAAGRRTWLSGRDTGAIPRRFLGRDIYDWLWWTVLRPSVDSRIGRRLMGGRLFAGDPLVGFTRRELARPLLTFAGRTVGVAEGHPVLGDGRMLDSVRSVLWCTGFRPDFRWIRLPVFGPDGYPLHRRGIVAGAPGLGFVGLRYQYRVGSSLLGGVGEDAAHVVRQLAVSDPTG